jgi:hypothetical protein
MKVEQRIGRVDRIGQRRKEVAIRHYFYQKTVEAQVYKALGDRIGWFETVIGELQPILQRAQGAIQRAAMASTQERDPIIARELDALQQEYETIQQHPSPIGQWAPSADPPSPHAPVTSSQLREILPSRPPWHEWLSSGPEQGTFHLVRGNSDLTVTFGPDPMAPPDKETSVYTSTYGSEIFDPLVDLPPPPSRVGIVRLVQTEDQPRIGYYGWHGNRWEPVNDLEGLTHLLQQDQVTSIPGVDTPRLQFEEECNRLPGQN